jgi:hypothetical protein
VLSFQAVGRQDVGLYGTYIITHSNVDFLSNLNFLFLFFYFFILRATECSADNGVSEPATATIDVKVLCEY